MLRHRLGLSQVAFARQTGISRNALIAYERGDGVPKSGALARIAQAGGSSVDWLLNGRVPRAQPPKDPEWEAALRKLRAIWRDPTRRRLAIVMLAALGRR
jgi:transcriptional regulator with XRE-family HTH domain